MYSSKTINWAKLKELFKKEKPANLLHIAKVLGISVSEQDLKNDD